MLFTDHNAVFGLADDGVDVIDDGASDLFIVVCEERHFEEPGAVESEFLFLDLAVLFEREVERFGGIEGAEHRVLTPEEVLFQVVFSFEFDFTAVGAEGLLLFKQ